MKLPFDVQKYTVHPPLDMRKQMARIGKRHALGRGKPVRRAEAVGELLDVDGRLIFGKQKARQLPKTAEKPLCGAAADGVSALPVTKKKDQPFLYPSFLFAPRSGI